MKRSEKEEIRSMSLIQLQEFMSKLNLGVIKLEADMMRMNGTSVLVRNYPAQPYEGKYGNLRNMKKKLAFVKQVHHNIMIRGVA